MTEVANETGDRVCVGALPAPQQVSSMSQITNCESVVCSSRQSKAARHDSRGIYFVYSKLRTSTTKINAKTLERGTSREEAYYNGYVTDGEMAFTITGDHS